MNGSLAASSAVKTRSLSSGFGISTDNRFRGLAAGIKSIKPLLTEESVDRG
jgi:hypothetical protein